MDMTILFYHKKQTVNSRFALLGFTLWLGLCATGFSLQSDGFTQYAIAGEAMADQYGKWQLPVHDAVTVTGVSITISTDKTTALPGGPAISPLRSGRSYLVQDLNGHSETITPSTIDCSGATICAVTAVFQYPHSGQYYLKSSDDGLQEAIDATAAAGGGIVRITPGWQGTSGQITQAVLPGGVLLCDQRSGNETWYASNGTTTVSLLHLGTMTSGQSPAVALGPDVMIAGTLSAKSEGGYYYAAQWCTTPGVLDGSCLANVVNAIGSSAGTVVLSPGDYAIDGNITIPSNVTLQPRPGSLLDPASGSVATILGDVQAGNWTIFSLAHGGTISFTGNHQVPALNPRWWGAVGDGTHDDTGALQATFTADEHSGTNIPVVVPPGVYLTGNLQLGDPATVVAPGTTSQGPGVVSLCGSSSGRGIYQTDFLAKPGTTGFLLQRHNLASFDIRDITIDGNHTADCLDMSWYADGASPRGVIKDLFALRCASTGLDLDGLNDTVISGLFIDLTGSPSSDPIAVSLQAAGGWAQMDDSILYGGVFIVSVQNMSIANSLIFDGVNLSGQAYNNINFSGVQFAVNAASGVVINSTNTGFLGSGHISCEECDFLAVGAGQSMIAGKFGTGGTFIGSRFDSGTMFGTITTSQSPYSPLFIFEESVFSTPPNTPSGVRWIERYCEMPGGTITNEINSNGFNLQAPTASVTPLMATGATGQVADLQDWSVGSSVLAAIKNDGSGTFPSITTGKLVLGGGTPMTSPPRLLYEAFFPGGLDHTWTASSWTLSAPISITRILAEAKTAPQGCVTNAVITASAGGTTTPLTITGNANDSGPLVIPVGSGASLSISVGTPASGCTAQPSDVEVILEYQMN